MNKLTKNYDIDESKNELNKKSKIIIINKELTLYNNKINLSRIHLYRKKIKLICYLTIMICLDIVKITFKFVEFFVNSEFNYIKTINYCLRYLHKIKYLEILIRD